MRSATPSPCPADPAALLWLQESNNQQSKIRSRRSQPDYTPCPGMEAVQLYRSNPLLGTSFAAAIAVTRNTAKHCEHAVRRDLVGDAALVCLVAAPTSQKHIQVCSMMPSQGCTTAPQQNDTLLHEDTHDMCITMNVLAPLWRVAARHMPCTAAPGRKRQQAHRRIFRTQEPFKFVLSQSHCAALAVSW